MKLAFLEIVRLVQGHLLHNRKSSPANSPNFPALMLHGMRIEY
jgi:hypothetical protein